jgi:FkbM family methyltransferase
VTKQEKRVPKLFPRRSVLFKASAVGRLVFSPFPERACRSTCISNISGQHLFQSRYRQIYATISPLPTIHKVAQILRSPYFLQAFLRHRVLAGIEHRPVLSADLATVVDIGANRGQFALAVRHWAPRARIISFEPLPEPAALFRCVFANDSRVTLHQSAVGASRATLTMHISGRDDSSSLLPISATQSSLFPGTAEVASLEMPVAPLSDFVQASDLQAPAMLKLDVQGYEYEALLGCESLLPRFQWIYC